MTRFNIGDDVIYKSKKTYIKEVLSGGKHTLYVLPRNKIARASELKKYKKK